MVQWVKHLTLSLQWLRLLKWRGFDPWPGELPHAVVQPKKKKKKKKKKGIKPPKQTRSSCCGSVVTNSTSIHKYVGLILGFTQWVKDLALP